MTRPRTSTFLYLGLCKPFRSLVEYQSLPPLFVCAFIFCFPCYCICSQAGSFPVSFPKVIFSFHFFFLL
ncbi:hypothetical protein RSAG8_08735, partial [Rhizoctonia solani AG-8 WAC10335]